MVSINKHTATLLLLLVFLFSGLSVAFSQEDFDEDEIDWSERLIQEVKLENPVYKPVVSIGAGILQFRGDVRDPYQKDITLGRPALNVDIYRALTPEFRFGFRFLYGNLSGNPNSEKENENFDFQTQLMSFGVGLTYNFAHIPIVGKKEDRVLSPYLSLGVEFNNYDIYGEKTSADGTEYHNWSDGSRRSLSQSDPNSADARRLYPDYDYETSLVQENLDGYSDPAPVTFGLPIDLGFDFILSQKVQFRIGYSYHITFNDMADNISTDGQNYDDYPEREGNAANDNFSYAYTSFTLDLFSKTTEERQLQFLDLGAGGIFDFWDMDGDFVMDIYDQCPWTPYGQLIDTVGCPLDEDNDGVPNYLDKEKNTSPDAFYVDTTGFEITEEAILAELNNSPALEQQDIYRHYPSLLDGTGLYRRFYKTIPEKFAHFDEDHDDYISLEELLKTIDSFFEGETDLSVDDLYELNEFFFIQ